MDWEREVGVRAKRLRKRKAILGGERMSCWKDGSKQIMAAWGRWSNHKSGDGQGVDQVEGNNNPSGTRLGGGERLGRREKMAWVQGNLWAVTHSLSYRELAAQSLGCQINMKAGSSSSKSDYYNINRIKLARIPAFTLNVIIVSFQPYGVHVFIDYSQAC